MLFLLFLKRNQQPTKTAPFAGIHIHDTSVLSLCHATLAIQKRSHKGYAEPSFRSLIISRSLTPTHYASSWLVLEFANITDPGNFSELGLCAHCALLYAGRIR